MLVRQSQLDALAQASLDRYYLEETAFFSEFAPELSRVMGDHAFRQYIRWAVARAQDRGFTLSNNIRFYIETMFTLGSDFDSDPQYPWAGAALSQRDFSEDTRAHLLHERLCAYLDAAAGQDNSFQIAALERVGARVPESFVQSPGPPERQFIDAAYSVYPEKAAFLGRDVLAQLAARGGGRCGEFNLNGAPGLILVSFLMLFLGHGVCDDALYPWIGSVLRDPSISDPNSRASRVYQRALVYADAARVVLARK